MTKIDKITIYTVIGAVIIIQAPHIAFTMIELSELEGRYAIFHGWSIAIGIEAMIVVLALNKLSRIAFIFMLISSLFVVGFYFNNGFDNINFTNAAIVLFSMAMPFATKKLSVSVQERSEETIIPKKKVSQKKAANVSTTVPKLSGAGQGLSQETLNWIKALSEQGLSHRKIEDKTGVSKSRVHRILQHT